MIDIKSVVKDNNLAKIFHCIGGVIYYHVKIEDKTYEFSVDMNDKDDVGNAVFPGEIRAIVLMRYIRKSIESGEFNLVENE